MPQTNRCPSPSRNSEILVVSQVKPRHTWTGVVSMSYLIKTAPWRLSKYQRKRAKHRDLILSNSFIKMEGITVWLTSVGRLHWKSISKEWCSLIKQCFQSVAWRPPTLGWFGGTYKTFSFLASPQTYRTLWVELGNYIWIPTAPDNFCVHQSLRTNTGLSDILVGGVWMWCCLLKTPCVRILIMSASSIKLWDLWRQASEPTSIFLGPSTVPGLPHTYWIRNSGGQAHWPLF